MTLSVETQALVNEAKERSQNALIADSMKYLIDYISHLDPHYWGDMSFVEPWKLGWKSASENRIKEAESVREAMDSFGTGLILAAADYSHTDINTSLRIRQSGSGLGQVAGPELSPFLNKMYGGKLPFHASPGGDLPRLKYYEDNDPKDGRYFVDIDNIEGSERGSLLFRLALLRDETIAGHSTLAESGGAMLMTPGLTALKEFFSNYNRLKNIQDKVVGQGMGAAIGRMPTEFLDETARAWPGVIINHAELFRICERTYESMRRAMVHDLDTLKGYWSSAGGARAYFNAANVMLRYLEDVRDKAKWMAEEGKKAGEAVDNLLLGYAKAGKERMRDIVDKYEAWDKAKEDAWNCLGEGNLLKALVKALSALSSAYMAELKEAISAAGVSTDFAERALAKQPNLAGAEGAPAPLPRIEAPDTDPHQGRPDNWWRGNSWKPGQPNPAVAIPTVGG